MVPTVSGHLGALPFIPDGLLMTSRISSYWNRAAMDYRLAATPVSVLTRDTGRHATCPVHVGVSGWGPWHQRKPE